jgi:anti-sigma regulatory factor (Ser/Thr protein kinase)
MLELALHVLDILQNAVEAGAARVILQIDEDEAADRLLITVTDNGRGMDERTVASVVDPFYTTRTTRHVGLGLPLYAMAAEQAGGALTIQSQPGRGTTVQASFQLGHPDRQPLGDIAGTLLVFLLSAQAPDLSYAHWVRPRGGAPGCGQAPAQREFVFDTAAIRAELDGLPFNHPLVARWLADFLAAGENALRDA